MAANRTIYAVLATNMEVRERERTKQANGPSSPCHHTHRTMRMVSECILKSTDDQTDGTCLKSDGSGVFEW